ncbi:Protein HPO-20 a [Aphelenchoides avenae]|nr:Protein HPO-20 a [Aphelenchus avenae]
MGKVIRSGQLEVLYVEDGTTQLEVFYGQTIGVFSMFLRNLLLRQFATVIGKRKWLSFLVQYVFMVFPMLFGFTLFADYMVHMMLIMAAVCAMMLLIEYATGTLDTKPASAQTLSLPVTYFRAEMLIGTCIAILAVDFGRLFPRRFAKTVTHGHSLMDIGTGMFVIISGFSHYFVSTRSRTAGKGRRPPSGILSMPGATLIILFVLGVGRSVFIMISGYGHSTVEYGVHWNFFVTLFCLKLYLTILPYPYCVPIGLVIGLSYQMALNSGLELWILRFWPNREGFIDQNREGIFSLFGYIFLISLAMLYAKVSTDILRRSELRAFHVFIPFAFSFFFFGLQLLSQTFFRMPSRRLANVPYAFDMMCMTTFTVGGFQVAAYVQPQENVAVQLPEAISRNALVYFLVGNLATGFVNICLETAVKSDVIPLQLLILTVYTLVNVLSVYLLHARSQSK